MKTVAEWFEEIEDDTVRENAIANTNESDLQYECRSIYTAIESAFIWAKTPEGHDYWAKVSFQYRPEEKTTVA